MCEIPESVRVGDQIDDFEFLTIPTTELERIVVVINLTAIQRSLYEALHSEMLDYALDENIKLHRKAEAKFYSGFLGVFRHLFGIKFKSTFELRTAGISYIIRYMDEQADKFVGKLAVKIVKELGLMDYEMVLEADRKDNLGEMPINFVRIKGYKRKLSQ